MKKRLEFQQTKESRQILKTLETWITKNYGKRCKAEAALCPTCKIWALYDLFRLELP